MKCCSSDEYFIYVNFDIKKLLVFVNSVLEKTIQETVKHTKPSPKKPKVEGRDTYLGQSSLSMEVLKAVGIITRQSEDDLFGSDALELTNSTMTYQSRNFRTDCDARNEHIRRIIVKRKNDYTGGPEIFTDIFSDVLLLINLSRASYLLY
jgi:hypothetical protein